MNKELEYRLKIGLYFTLLGVITFLILYLTLPSPKLGPQIRVLYISYAGQSMTTTELKPSPPPENIVVIDAQELKLSGDDQPFYKNNIVLECRSEFPITWNYEGYGIPQVEVHNGRNFENIQDTTTYFYSSSLNLMPIVESSSGKFACFGLSPEELKDFDAAFVQLFIPGPKIFVLQQDLTIESDLSDELLIPCQVSDPMANISLLLKGEEIDENFIKSYHPAKGFALNAKFMEENDPFSTFVCQDQKTKKKSGRINVSLKKESLVIPSPIEETVHFSPNQFNGTFSCHAKENVTLKFRRIQNSKKVEYALNLSSEFGFTATVRFEESDLRDGSLITCLTLAQGTTLHVWMVALNAKSKQEEIQTTKLFYKADTDEYLCCGQMGKNRPKLWKLSCSHPIECKIQHNCFTLESSTKELEEQRCQEVSSPPPKMSDSGFCIHYKMEYEKQNNISTGELKCGSSGSGTAEVYNFVNLKTENGSVLQNSEKVSDGSSTSFSPFENLSNFLLGVETIGMKRYGQEGISIRKYQCRGPKFYFASFVWQISRYGGNMDYLLGKDHYDGGWITSEVQFPEPFTRLKQANKIYCIASIWNSDIKFVFKSAYINSTHF